MELENTQNMLNYSQALLGRKPKKPEHTLEDIKKQQQLNK